MNYTKVDVFETNQNSLLRDGTSQEQRSHDALGTLYARMDERRNEELLSLIYRYARYIYYYRDNPNTPEGNWQSFFADNIAFRYAGIQQLASADLENSYLEAKQLFEARITNGSFWLQFNRILDIALQLNTWLSHKDANDPLYKMLYVLVKNDFSKALARLIAVANTFNSTPEDSQIDLKPFLREDEAEAWDLQNEKLLARDTRLAKLDAASRTRETETQAELDDIFQIFYKGLLQVQQFSRDHFEEALAGTGRVEPHIGLLHTFIKLFLMVRDGKGGLNNITKLHLDFFYTQILGLQTKPHRPDEVHFIVELAKQVNTHLLDEKTTLKDGKDAKGKEINFATTSKRVFNQAKVEKLRTLFRDTQTNLYVAPIANSADGLGAPFQDSNNISWPLLGAKDNNTPLNPNLKYPFARTGVVFASPVLLLNEGKRTVALNIKLGNMASFGQEFSNLFTTRHFQISMPRLADFEKAGVAKELVAPLRQKLAILPGLSKQLTEEQFETFTGIGAPVSRKLKQLSFTSLLKIFYSNDKEWLLAPLPTITFDVASSSLRIQFVLEPTDKPFTPLSLDMQAASFPLPGPAIKIVFDHEFRSTILGSDEKPWYERLSKATIEDVFINVKAENVKNLVLGNDDGLVDGNKKFFPFTGLPKKDSSFYIGSNELFRKKLTGFQLTAEWDGQPLDFKEHYRGYETPPPKNISFTATVEKLVNGSWQSLPNSSPANKFKLFTQQPDPPAGQDHSVNPVNTWIVDPLDEPGVPHSGFLDIPVVKQPQPLTPFDNNSVEGFIRLKLDRHFYHQEYPVILASAALSIGKFDYDKVEEKISNTVTPGVYEQSITVSNATVNADNLAQAMIGTTPTPPVIAGVTNATFDARTKASSLQGRATELKNLISDGNKVVILPNPPYTPAIKSFFADYSASASMPDITLVHLYPYEESNHEVIDMTPPSKPLLLPSFDHEGALYIGLHQAIPGGTLSLLFQLAAFSANPDIEPAPIEWHFLKDNRWIPLRKDLDIISDTTHDLLVSGIIDISLPWEANVTHTILPSGYYWLRVSTGKSSTAVCKGVVVAAQGGHAIFVNNENDLLRLGKPLEGNRISGLLIPQSEIKKLSQPFPSFGGRKKEDESHFNTRVSERLRHKGRAITVFDYERMTLEEFPDVFKVKCIPHTKICRNKNLFTALPAPGWVTLALIPEISDFSAETRLQPKLSRILLRKVESFFKDKTSGFVKVHAINPVYKYVDFKGKIRFHKGRDESFYNKMLMTDVSEYLSPWIKGSSRDIVFGGVLMMSAVLHFIEQRDYVSYVTDFEMSLDGKVVKVITASTPWTVLIAGEQKYDVLKEDCKLVKIPWKLL